MKEQDSRKRKFLYTWSLYKQWFKWLLPHSKILFPGLFFLITALLAEVSFPKILGFGIDSMLAEKVIQRGQVTLPLVGITALEKAFFYLLILLLILATIQGLSAYFRNYLISLVGEKVHIDVRQKLFRHIQSLPFQFFGKNQTGTLVARLTSDTDALWHLLFGCAMNILAPILTLCVIWILLFNLNVWMTLFLTAIIPVIGVLLHRARKQSLVATRKQRQVLGAIYARLNERISAIRLIRLFTRNKREERLYRLDLMDLAGRNLDMLRAMYRLGSASEWIQGITIGLIVSAGGWFVLKNWLSVGELVQFYVYSGMLFVPIQKITNTSAQVFSQGQVALERINQLLSTPICGLETSGDVVCPDLRGDIQFENVSFSYEKNEPVLKSINFDITSGQRVALVGISGSGKSTLAALLCRLYPLDKGFIKADNHDISQFVPYSYRKQIGYVDQDCVLFAGSVAENIAFGMMKCNMEKIREAAIQANAHEFIERLPEGYHTMLGERGTRLSGGQRQRLSLARALVRDPKILILDEPTSALDTESETKILQALNGLQGKVTILLIAHRLSSIKGSDCIFVLQNGEIIEQGKHEELLLQTGVYSQWCKHQLQQDKSGGKKELYQV